MELDDAMDYRSFSKSAKGFLSRSSAKMKKRSYVSYLTRGKPFVALNHNASIESLKKVQGF
jgi:hypothetical protein